jgi:hypothetical protein
MEHDKNGGGGVGVRPVTSAHRDLAVGKLTVSGCQDFRGLEGLGFF